MPSRKQTHTREKLASRKQPPQPNSSNMATLTPQRQVATLIQRARLKPRSLFPREVQQLQRAVGNREVERLLAGQRRPSGGSKRASFSTLQAKLVAGLGEDRFEPQGWTMGRPHPVNVGVIQAKLDPNEYSRQAFKASGLTAGFKLFGKTSFGKILKTLDKYHKTTDRREEKALLNELIVHCQSWLDSPERDKKKSRKKQAKDDDKEEVITDLQDEARDEIGRIDETLDTSLFETGLEAEMLSKIVAGTAPVGGGPDTRTDQQLLNVYETLEADLDHYAKRSGTLSKFADRANMSLVNKALSLPRNPDGSLSPQAIYLMSQVAAGEAKGYVEGGKAATTAMGGANVKKKSVAGQIKFSLEQDLNTLTGQTQNPDLFNLINAPKVPNPDQQVVDTVQIGGVTMKLYHSIVDVNYAPRLASFRLAIQKITEAGFALPTDLLVHLPKYGRNIDAISECQVEGSTPRAVFNAPNFIHLRGDTVRNPIDMKLDDTFKNLSTQIEESEGDSSGAPSVVHEMGHMMHYQNAPGKFLGLHMTTFKGPSSQLATTEVSAYGANPREFVAEVFLGLVYGKDFSDDVLRMYRDLGGAIPPALATRVAGL